MSTTTNNNKADTTNVLDFFEGLKTISRKRGSSYNSLVRSLVKQNSIGYPHYRRVLAWVSRNISYRSSGIGSYQEPKQTLDLGTGDCDDQAVLIADTLTKIGASPREILIVVGSLESSSTTSPITHTVVLYKGQVFCTINGLRKRVHGFKETGRVSYMELTQDLEVAL